MTYPSGAWWQGAWAQCINTFTCLRFQPWCFWKDRIFINLISVCFTAPWVLGECLWKGNGKGEGTENFQRSTSVLELQSFFFINYFCLGWVFVAALGLSLATVRGATLLCSALQGLLLWSTSSRCMGLVAVAHGLSCSAASGVFPDKGSNSCALC